MLKKYFSYDGIFRNKYVIIVFSFYLIAGLGSLSFENIVEVPKLFIRVLLEEMIFRKLLFNFFRKKLNNRNSILIVAFLFSIFHFNLFGFFDYFFSSIFYSMLYLNFKNILIPVAFHLFYNLIYYYFGDYGFSLVLINEKQAVIGFFVLCEVVLTINLILMKIKSNS